jgi:Right handed beta helix region
MSEITLNRLLGAVFGLMGLMGAWASTAAAAENQGRRPVSGPLVIENQRHQIYAGLNITAGGGQDCIVIKNSTDITIQNSEIGPCGGEGININGGGKIKIFDNYIHPETLSPGCCDHNDGVLLQNTSNVIIQGNVIAYSESNVEATQAVSGLTVVGNFLLNPRGPFPRGQNVQAWNAQNVVVKNNYALSSHNTSKYLYPDDQEDSINFGIGSGFVAMGNYITGGQSPTGCGLIADDGANGATFTGNRLVDTGECGIGIASGTKQIVAHNKILNRTPVPGGGDTALYVWSQYKGTGCGPVTVNHNIATEIRSDGTQSGYWNGGGCEPVTLQGNVWDEAAEKLLTPVEQKLPPPLIPPQPHACVIASPYATQTAWPPCQ